VEFCVLRLEIVLKVSEPAVIWKSSYRVKQIAHEVEENTVENVLTSPVSHNCFLLHIQVIVRPCEVGEEIRDLLVSAQFTGNVFSQPVWIRDSGDLRNNLISIRKWEIIVRVYNERQDSRVEETIFLKKFV
jgi:hypothetical protein